MMTWEDVVISIEAAWVEAHLLVVAAHQMENWHRRLVVERGDPARQANATLDNLRNTLEHLDEALFIDGAPIRDPASKRKHWALEKPPRPPQVNTFAEEIQVLGLLRIGDLESAALALADGIEEEVIAPGVDAYVQVEIDRRVGK
jgi:hypothetical protein